MSNISYTVFRRQFYIGANPQKGNENWIYRKIQTGQILSYCKYLPVKFINDKNGNEWVLIGDAYQSLPDRGSPKEEIECMDDTNQIEDLYASWAGRWVLIGDEKLHLDATGLLGCFYQIDQNQIKVSSVAGLLSGTHTPDVYTIKKSAGIEFYPLPDSGFQGVSKLLPSQTLSLTTGEIQWRSLKTKIPQLSYEESINYLSSLLNTTIKNACKDQNKKVVLALTGGYDSRLLMSSLNNCGIPYEAITFHYPLIRPADKDVPKRLASISKIGHRLIRRRRIKKDNWNKYNLHSSGHAVERDREYMLYQQWDALQDENIILLRAGGFEIASSKMRTRLPVEFVDGMQVSRTFNGNQKQGESFNKWVEWIKQTPHENIDWRDRYYWEQRVSGWLSCTEQALDVLNIDRLVPSNSLLFYNLMLQLPEPIRLKKKHQIDMIRLLSPNLLDVPFNPSMSKFYQTYLKLVFKFEKWKNKNILKILSSNVLLIEDPIPFCICF